MEKEKDIFKAKAGDFSGKRYELRDEYGKLLARGTKEYCESRIPRGMTKCTVLPESSEPLLD